MSKPKILIADDVPANIRILWEIIKDDYEVSVTTSGSEAVEIARSESPPDLILLDIMMPEIDGYEVCRILKADENTRSIPIIFITAMTREEDETKGLELGAVDYITKPFRPAIVKARIRIHLEVKQNRDHLEDIVKARTAELRDMNTRLIKDIAERKRTEDQLRQAKDEELRLLEMTTALSYELNLNRLLKRIMDTTTVLLCADRCTLFLHDEKSNELWSRIAGGLKDNEIRFPAYMGIAGSVFTSGEIINIPDAYSDKRFNPEVDKKTGYRTCSILCMPVKNKTGKTIGVVQVLNKKGGPFSDTDERRLRAFSAQASIALENATLFEDVLNMKNYNESMLESMSNGIISLDADRNIVKCNASALRILGEKADEFSEDASERISMVLCKINPWIKESISKVMETEEIDLTMDTNLMLAKGVSVSVNLTVVPLINIQQELIGSLMIIEDITREKRLKGTIARYMTKEVADKLMEGGDAVLGGQIQEATIMFSDIRSFTTISEKIGPQETVSLLNEYFTLMVDIIFRYEGILDKYIGDAIMAVFGAPFNTGEDHERAVKTAIEMMEALKEFNKKRKDPINIGIGINTDEVLSGNIGSLKRMDYTVIGDGVNLASRLEGANKLYGTNILVSEKTFRGLKNNHFYREIDLIRVKGKTRPVGIYQILDYQDKNSFPNINDVLELFQEGLNFYRCRSWKKGIENFSRILKLNRQDKPSHLYLKRCQYFAEKPPPDDWDSVWDMKSK